MRGRNGRPLLAATCSDAPVASSEKGLLAGMADSPGGFEKGVAKPTVATSDGGVLTLSSRLVVAWADAGPGGKMGCGGKPAHVGAGLDQDLFRCPAAYARNLIQALQSDLERAHALDDLLIQGGNLGLD